MPDKHSDQLCINTIRTLSMDAVQAANSGHPGAVGVLFTISGQNNFDAIYPNFSFYYYWDKKGSATMR